MTDPQAPSPRAWPAGRAVAAAAASALLLWAASPAVGISSLAWIALVPVAAATLAGGGRFARAAVPLCYLLYLELLLVPAFPFGLADGQWGDPVLPVLIDGSPVLAIALVAVPLLAALLYALGFGLPWGAGRLRGNAAIAATVLVPALAWTALDFVRAGVDPGALWGPLFLSQAGSAPGALAALGGPWLVTLAIVAVNWGIAVTVVHRRPIAGIVPAIVVLAAVAAGTRAERAGGEGSGVPVAAIQPGYDTAERDRPLLRRFGPGTWHLAALDVIDDLEPLTRQAARRGARLVIWPQAVMYADPREHPEIRRRLEQIASETGTSIVLGFFLPAPVREDYAIAVAGDPPRLGEPHPKRRPLWYLGEDRARGEPRPLRAEPATVAAILGVDTLAPAPAGALLGGGAELLAAATHDWEQSAGPHRAWARLLARAVGAPLVRADWRYGSAIWSAEGATLADAGSNRRRTTVEATISAATGSTPYRAVGDLVGWLALGGSLLAGTMALASRRSRKRRAPAAARSGDQPRAG
jgi:apolipoprotein N-acyltransferase